MKFRELPVGALFTVGVDLIHSATAIKIDEKSAIRLDTGERIDVHHNKNVNDIAKLNAAAAVGVLRDGEVVLYSPAHKDDVSVYHVFVLRHEFVPKSMIEPAKPKFLQKEIDKSIQGLIDILSTRIGQAQNVVNVLKESVCDNELTEMRRNE